MSKFDAVSGSRLPPPDRAAMDARGQALYDRIAHRHGGLLSGLHGPGTMRLYSPEFCRLSQDLIAYLRDRSPLERRLHEVAVLVTARAFESAFEWNAHVIEARRHGVADTTIDTIRTGAPWKEGGMPGIPDDERLVAGVANQLIVEHRLEQDRFDAALAVLGEQALVDLVAVMGHYASTALLLAAFATRLPDGQSDPF